MYRGSIGYVEKNTRLYVMGGLSVKEARFFSGSVYLILEETQRERSIL